MLNKKRAKINPKEFSWRGMRWQLIDQGKSLHTTQKTGVVDDSQISEKASQSLSTEISENVSLMAQFFANDSLGG